MYGVARWTAMDGIMSGAGKKGRVIHEGKGRSGRKPARSQNESQIFMKSSWKSFVAIQLYHSTNPISFCRPPRRPGYARIYFRRVVHGHHERLCTPWNIFFSVCHDFTDGEIFIMARRAR